ncbi:MAG: class I SAM-dependent methyltransferase [Bacilli bacterium]|nr:class I SAM-dependent methyltransferase [Bacilli bacterium]
MVKVISEQRRKDLEEAIELYLSAYQKKDFVNDDYVEYAGYYRITNEPFSKFLAKANFSNTSKTLSVLSSGDQVFEMVRKGIKKIDTFDINRMTEYFALGFKKRAIECLSYEQFLSLNKYDRIVTKHNNENLEIEKYVIENMEEEYKWFWQELIASLKGEGFNVSVFHFVIDYLYLTKFHYSRNPYMADKEKYKELQQKLLKAKITFQQADIKELPKKFQQYDLIYLSNILEYHEDIFEKSGLPPEEAIKLLKKIYNKMLNNNGEIILTDLMDWFYPSFAAEKLFKENHELIVDGSDRGYILKKKK